VTILPKIPECYRILGVSPKAGLDEVKRRFRLLALEFHPDRNPQDPKAAARFREVAEAYGAICQRRRQEQSPPPGQKPRKTNGNGRRVVSPQDLADLFGFAESSIPFSSFGGPDFRYDLQIPFLAAMWGLEQEIEFRRLVRCGFCQATGLQPGSHYQECPACNGRGRLWASPGQLKIGPVCDTCQGQGKIITHPCTHCRGQGYLSQLKKYRITIPPGVEDGARIRINGEGGEGFRQGPPGHLVVVVHVEPHRFFTRQGNDLHATLEVSFAQAVLGARIEIPTLVGVRILKLPRGAQSGQSFLFPGLGVPVAGDCHPGNLIITIHITNKPRFAESALYSEHRESITESN